MFVSKKAIEVLNKRIDALEEQLKSRTSTAVYSAATWWTNPWMTYSKGEVSALEQIEQLRQHFGLKLEYVEGTAANIKLVKEKKPSLRKQAEGA
jgi:hypothetical protein